MDFSYVRGGGEGRGAKVRGDVAIGYGPFHQRDGNRRDEVFWCTSGYYCSFQLEGTHLKHVSAGCVYVRSTRRGARLKVGGERGGGLS